MSDIEDLIAEARRMPKGAPKNLIPLVLRLANALEAQQAKITQLKAKHNETEMYLRLEREAARQNLERAERAEAKITSVLTRHTEKYGESPRYAPDDWDRERDPIAWEPYTICNADGKSWPCEVHRILSDAPTETERTTHD